MSKSVEFMDTGFEGLEELLKEYSKKISDTELVETLSIGANLFVKDLKKLAKPRSKISASGYTHLVDSFKTRKTEKTVEVGWGKFYGSFVERGTKKMGAQPHLEPTFDSNKELYYRAMIEHVHH